MTDDYLRRLWIWLSLVFGSGTVSTDRLLLNFDYDIKALYNAEAGEYEKILTQAGRRPRRDIVDRLCDKSLAGAEAIIEKCSNLGCGIVSFSDKEYPNRLRMIKSKPLVLYYFGKLPDFDNEVAVAVVGTRQMTEYGRRNAYTLSYDIAKSGGIVVSGLARGVDGIAHRGCLDAGGTTVAVVATGLETVYPSEHERLEREIRRNGAVISEYPPETKVNSYNFPKRNRIISGLSLGTVVIEAGRKSGALITAGTAIEQGRDVYALPGNVGEHESLGTNELIKKGARLVTEASEIISVYEQLYPNKVDVSKIPSVKVGLADGPKYLKSIQKQSEDKNDDYAEVKAPEKDADAEKTRRVRGTNTPQMSARDLGKLLCGCGFAEQQIYGIIPENEPILPDTISEALNMPVSEVMVSLTMLEIRGLVTSVPGGGFIRKHF